MERASLARLGSLLAALVLVAACRTDAKLTGASPASADAGPDDASAGHEPCGYQGRGQVLRVGTELELCLPPVVCTPSETCPRGLGDCVAGRCQYKPGYHGLATLGEAWATYYCELATGGCDGSVLKPRPYELAKSISQTYGAVCADEPSAGGTCVGVAAAPPAMVGNSQIARDPTNGDYVSSWGLGMTAASGLCYRIAGNAGVAVVALSERCGGYCKCGGSAAYEECSRCINAPDTTTECACVGTAPPLYGACCGAGCGGAPPGECDWCANNNHPHFDLDNATFRHVCGALGLQAGSCRLTKVEIIENCYPARPDWPE